MEGPLGGPETAFATHLSRPGKGRECMNEASGYKAAIVTDREPKLTFQMEEDLAANVDMWVEYTTALPSSRAAGRSSCRAREPA